MWLVPQELINSAQVNIQFFLAKPSDTITHLLSLHCGNALLPGPGSESIYCPSSSEKKKIFTYDQQFLKHDKHRNPGTPNLQKDPADELHSE